MCLLLSPVCAVGHGCVRMRIGYTSVFVKSTWWATFIRDRKKGTKSLKRYERREPPPIDRPTKPHLAANDSIQQRCSSGPMHHHLIHGGGWCIRVCLLYLGATKTPRRFPVKSLVIMRKTATCGSCYFLRPCMCDSGASNVGETAVLKGVEYSSKGRNITHTIYLCTVE